MRQSEQIKGQISEQGAAINTQLNEVAGKRAPHTQRRHCNSHAQKNGKQGQKSSERGKKCYQCGKAHSINYHCPARNAECRNCKKRGHFAAVCHTRVVREVMAPSSRRTENKVNFLGAVTHVDESNNPWTVNLQINGTD